MFDIPFEDDDANLAGANAKEVIFKKRDKKREKERKEKKKKKEKKEKGRGREQKKVLKAKENLQESQVL
jgi:hypothetical protein